MKTHKFSAILAAIMSVMMLLSACGAPPGTGETSGTTPSAASAPAAAGGSIEGMKIGWSQRGMTLAWWEAMVSAGVTKAEELGAKVVVVDAQNKPEKQLSDVEDLIAQGCQAIIIDACDPIAVKSALDNAISQGIPVIAIDSSIEQDTIAVKTFITSDNYTIGYNSGYELARAWNSAKTPTVAIMSGGMGDVEGFQRRCGFTAGFAEYQYENFGLCGMDIVAQRYAGDWDADRAMTQMQDILTKYPDQIDIIFSEGDAMAIGCLNAVELSGQKLPLIAGIDGQREALALIKDGKYTVCGVNSACLIGQTAVEAIQKVMAGESLPTKIMVDSPTITAANVDQYYDPAVPYL